MQYGVGAGFERDVERCVEHDASDVVDDGSGAGRVLPMGYQLGDN